MANKEAPPVTALDTSVMIAGLLAWHEKHEAASAELVRLLEEKGEIVIPLHALVEAYSVLTRLPSPHRISPTDALAILEGSFKERAVLVGLDGHEGWGMLGDFCRRQIAGATSYDGLIATCARRGGARRILTLNRTHFERLGIQDLEIVVPGGGAH